MKSVGADCSLVAGDYDIEQKAGPNIYSRMSLPLCFHLIIIAHGIGRQ